MKSLGRYVVVFAILNCFLQGVSGHSFLHHAAAFSLRRNGRAASTSSRNKQVQQNQLPQSLEDLAVQQSTRQKTGQTELQFQASTNYATAPLPTSTTSKSTLQNRLADFLFTDLHRDMILAGADSQNPVQVIHQPDIELYRLWQVETNRHPSQLIATPAVGDAILKVTTTGIHFPGLTLKTVATVGCKQVQTESGGELQITLIQDELQAEGPEPLKWVFHQLTGTGSKQGKRESTFPNIPFSPFGGQNNASNEQQQERRTHSTNVISAECITTNDDDDSSSVVFLSKAKLSISVSFPSILLKILPVSKQMAERQGSEAINRVVSRDIGPSLEALKAKYQQECTELEKNPNN